MEEKLIKLSNFTLSFNTFALFPVFVDNQIYTRVIERDRDFLVEARPSRVIHKSCSDFGTSFKLATNKSREYLGARNKLPIVVAYDYGTPCIFLPTLSPSSHYNVWFAMHAIEYFEGSGPSKSIISFKNGQDVGVEVSILTMRSQLSMAYFLQQRFELKRPSLF
ncbi:competence protein ComK [Viridibacillus sp. YIM B01967]|uniref:Competence protein ComK n=1 Tax=Viridibacillus soli TaxID=2798301 RepID=A0ABS1H609_9BACL|nr:competence protein ComK [Viridibacillus soli]MBK3494859.1 competence protein ComK [Viridibacillus soli]